jgi:uncharacterized cupin superfamily protein
MPEARLKRLDNGLAPVEEGWFVVNVRDAAWIENEAFGAACIFESDPRVLRSRPDLEPRRFPDLGVNLRVIQPGQSVGLYHAESAQEDFLVLAGECIAVIEEEERRLRTWDLVHCPAGTKHVFVGAGEGPCVLFGTGSRAGEKSLVYPRSETALRLGAGVERETDSPHEAYAPHPHWRPAASVDMRRLPWGDAGG